MIGEHNKWLDGLAGGILGAALGMIVGFGIVMCIAMVAG